MNYLWATRCVLEIAPDILVASLWRSCLVLLAAKLIRPCTSIVVLLHFPKSVHLLDRVASSLAMRFADEVWADSEATLAARIPRGFRGRSRVVSFLTEPVCRDEISASVTNATACSFVFWGRLHKQKGLDRSLKLFAMLFRLWPTATYTIIGPDCGERVRLEALCRALRIAGAVHFLGPMSRADIQVVAGSHRFYLQTSVLEGMAMSVVEAMQWGLVPIVTPVGEIARYCRDGENAVLVGDDQAVVSRVGHLLTHPDDYARLSSAAVRHWRAARLYRDDFLEACGELVRRRCAG